MKRLSNNSQTLQQVNTLGAILGVWAHPDDETFMIGGLMAIAVANGQLVHCITATKGEAGVQDTAKWPAESLGDIRANEQAAALKILGLPEPRFLNYQDGHCSGVPSSKAIDRIVSIIDSLKPDTVITFAPDGLTGHPDHVAVSGWATQATRQASHKANLYYAVQTQESYDAFWHVVDEQFSIYFATQSPKFVPGSECDVLLQLAPDISTKKTAALEAMPSQYEAMFSFLGDKGVRAAVSEEALVKVA